MTSEQRLDRLERVAKLMVKAGLRARRQIREYDEKILILIDAQIKTEAAFARLAEAQTDTDRAFKAFIDRTRGGPDKQHF